MSDQTQNQQAQAPAKKTIMDRQNQVKDRILEIIAQNEAEGGHYPKDYSAANALNGAWLYLIMAKDKDDKPVLEVCSPDSVMKSLLKMLSNGLSVLKDQCYLIAYAGELSCDISYHGKELMAKRAGLIHITASAIYEGDDFSFEVNSETGTKKILEHKQTLESIANGTKIKGAYAVAKYEDGRVETTIMTKEQIHMAWNQRKGNGLTKAHQNFPDEMACKTVRNRALKHIIKTSDDRNMVKMTGNENVIEKPKQNYENIEFQEAEEVKTNQLDSPKENPLDKLAKKEQEAELVQNSKQAESKGQQMEMPDFAR